MNAICHVRHCLSEGAAADRFDVREAAGLRQLGQRELNRNLCDDNRRSRAAGNWILKQF